MMDFPLVAGAYEYRALRKNRKPKQQRGWDVWALQTALEGARCPLTEAGKDGYFGGETRRAVLRAQHKLDLTEDGIAGVLTQRALAVFLLNGATRQQEVDPRRIYGQIEKESSWLLGNHTAPYTNGSRDHGVCQRNDQYASKEQGYDVPGSIEKLTSYIAAKHIEYSQFGLDAARAWNLAQGAWNAPAWTDRLARGQDLSAAQLDHIEGYIERVTAYVT